MMFKAVDLLYELSLFGRNDNAGYFVGRGLGYNQPSGRVL